MWRAVADLGFAGGRVLEPGCGSGNFVGLAPDGCEITGVEADPTTAAVARHLYGARATIRAGALRVLRRAGRALRPGDRQRPLRQGHPARPPPQPLPAGSAQLLHRQEPGPDPAGRAGGGAHLPLHRRCPQPGGPPGDRSPSRPGRCPPLPGRRLRWARPAPRWSATCSCCAAAGTTRIAGAGGGRRRCRLRSTTVASRCS